MIGPVRRRALLALVLSPLLLPVALLWNVTSAVRAAWREFLWQLDFRGVLGNFYRNIYRVARYGSVHDA